MINTQPKKMSQRKYESKQPQGDQNNGFPITNNVGSAVG